MEIRRGDKTLYIGIDESNHGRSPEIIVAVSSTIYSDASPVKTSEKVRIDEGSLMRFFSNKERDFRYTSIKREKDSAIDLEYIACCLIEKLVAREKKEEVDVLEILIDGEGKVSGGEEIVKLMRDYGRRRSINSIRIKYYPKKGFSYKYPRMLFLADSLAHYLFRHESFRNKADAERKRIDF
ncbi:MAG: hypothetical protein QXS38_01190 [Candidatus Pacearchaeota archaeon]